MLALLPQQSPARLTVVVRRLGRPVAGASVRADSLSTQSDDRGIAALSLSGGTHVITVAAIGFLPETLSVVVPAARDTSISVELTHPVVELEAVTVEATRTARRIEEEPARVEVLAGEDVAEKTEMRPADLTMLLSEMVGVRTQVTAPTMGSAVVRIQGLRGHYTLFLTDGLPLHGAQSGGLSLLQVPPLDLRQVEVVKGAASALYGPDALGGVVNLVSQRPTAKREAVLNQSSTGGTDGFLWISQQFDQRWGLTLIGDGHHQDQRDVSGDGWADFAGFSRAQVRPRVFWAGDNGGTLMVTASYMSENRKGGTVGAALAPDGQPFVESLETHRGDAGLIAQVPLGTQSSPPVLNVRLAASKDRQARQFGSAPEHSHQTILFGETSVAYSHAGIDWVAGLSWERETFDSPDVTSLDYTFQTPAVFAQVTAAPLATLTATLSVRCDAQNVHGTYCSPRLSTLSKLGRQWALRLSAGGGIFVPTPFTEETEPIALSSLQPLTGVRVERARNASADLTATFGPLELSTTVYGSRVERAVMLRPVAGDTTGRVELVNSTGPTDAFGAEAFAVYDRTPFVVTVHYAYVLSSEVDPATGVRRDVPLNPRDNLFLDLAYENVSHGSWVALEIDWSGRQALDNDPYRAESPPYVVAGALASQQFGKVKLFLSLQNMTGVRQTHYDPILLPARGPGGRWTTDQWAPLVGRSVNGGVRVQF